MEVNVVLLRAAVWAVVGERVGARLADFVKLGPKSKLTGQLFV
jgi:hypothetical protein